MVTPEGKGALCTEAELATKPASFHPGGKEAIRSEAYLVPGPWHLPHPGASIFLLIPPGPPELGARGGISPWRHTGVTWAPEALSQLASGCGLGLSICVVKNLALALSRGLAFAPASRR